MSVVDNTAPDACDGASTYTVGGSTGIVTGFTAKTIDTGRRIPTDVRIHGRGRRGRPRTLSTSSRLAEARRIPMTINARPRLESATRRQRDHQNTRSPRCNPLKDAADNEVGIVRPGTTVDQHPRRHRAGGAAEPRRGHIQGISTASLGAGSRQTFWSSHGIIPWHNGSPIEKFQYRYATGSAQSPHRPRGWTSPTAPRAASKRH